MILDFVDEPICKEEIYNQMIDYFKTYEKLILYHGTTNLWKDKILQEGLLSRSQTNNSVFKGRSLEGRDLESHDHLVYVGSLCTARYIGINAPNRFGGNLIIFKLLLDRADLFPDEDSEKEDGLESLISLGGAAIKNRISPDKIIGYSDIGKYSGKDSERRFKELRNIGDVNKFTDESYRYLLDL